MALTQVRAQIAGQWYTLTYNSSTSAYEATLTAPSASFSQVGGYYNVTVEATNDSGTVVTADGSDLSGLQLVVKDATPPGLVLVSPAQGYLLTNKPVIIVTATDDASGVDTSATTVALDGGAVSVSEISTAAISGGYQISYTPAAALSEGAHTVVFTVKDADGNATSLTLAYTVDTAAPTLDITYPVDGQYIEAQTFTISGTVSDATSGLSTVTLNGTAIDTPDGVISETVTLEDGTHSFAIAATDAAGNTSQKNLSVVVDTAPPELTVTSPTDDLFTTNPLLTVSGTATDSGSGIAHVLIDGVEVQLSDSGEFSKEITLSEAENIITVIAADAIGRTTTVSRTVTLDTVAPRLKLTGDYTGVIVDIPSLAVTGSATDAVTNPVAVAITTNGESIGEIAVSDTGEFTVDVPLQLGENTISITAADEAGLTSTVELYKIRLITDRTGLDIERLAELAAKRWEDLSAEEQSEWLTGMRGAYNASDLNRVTFAMEYLTALLHEYGYNTGFAEIEVESGRTQWQIPDIPQPEQMAQYIANVKGVRSKFSIAGIPEAPADMQQLTYSEVNSIEAILVMVDSLAHAIDKSYWYSGEISCGEF